MSDAVSIKFARDYGYSPASPFWVVWNEDGRAPMFKHRNREAAEAEAARLATVRPGHAFHVLVVMSTISTSTEVVGQKFDPTRAVYEEVCAPEAPPETEAGEVHINAPAEVF